MNFDKIGYQLTLFSLQPSTSDEVCHGNRSVQRESYFIFLNLYEFEDFLVIDRWKNLQWMDRQRPLLMTFETFKRPTTAAAASECGTVWHTADSYRWGNWRMEVTSPVLCPWNGIPFWTFVTIWLQYIIYRVLVYSDRACIANLIKTCDILGFSLYCLSEDVCNASHTWVGCSL